MATNEQELMHTKLLWTTKEVAGLLGSGERSVWRWSRSGAMPAPVKINGAVRFRRSEVEDWVEGGCRPIDGRAGQ